ncbi:hypothetical protein [Aestuariibaculum suncheonense]|uniref:CHAT domain-containing protein n=2 Tax=Aestuariibaculum suncheonense TaxID=1028745 RepID=A0A8J6U9T7_9FLAO|nr:hypothetical protein [Aestuariibaculum suncheonense]MBD0834463.1 hypothetical protein [Aestuariibaculum suncheonense]
MEDPLSAVVYSHINSPNHYSLIFGFSSVSIGKDCDDINQRDEHQISRSSGIKSNINFGNTLSRIGGCDYLILVGLTDYQKSFLTFLEEYNVIEINNLEDVDTFLHPISFRESIPCRPDQIFTGLQIASNLQMAITIDDDAEHIEVVTNNKGGLIIVENNYFFETLVATNYAISINADLIIIESYDFHEKEFLKTIEAWREEVKVGSEQISLQELKGLIYNRIDGIQFQNYDFVTFFTIGAPYSLIIDNVIPCTHIGLKLNPDFFIFNNIFFQDNFNIGSGIVFSPRFFSSEETDYVINKLTQNNYYVNALIENQASSTNLDYYVKELPFNILHLCTHGNQSKGSLIIEKYTDEYGNEHIFEYNLLFSLMPEPGMYNENGEPLIKVLKLVYPKKLNGYAFRTKEFKDQNYPSSIFPKMFSTVPVNENEISRQEVIVENAHGIECHSFSHFAKFSHLSANQHSPFIFNNICWSAYEIKDHLLAVRARGYIGTLWAVNNDVAVKTAETFYDSFFEKTVLSSLQDSLVHSKATNNRNIYMYYGLHFTSFNKAKSVESSKDDIVKGLLTNISSWKTNYDGCENTNTRYNILAQIRWNQQMILKYFRKELLKLIGKKALIDFLKLRVRNS